MRLIADAITVRYGSRTVLAHFDGVFAVGEAVALTGPSGVGKTSLLSVLGGLLPATRGRASLQVDGTDVDGVFGWVHQNSAALKARTARDNVAMGALARGLGWRQASELATRLLDRVGLTGRVEAVADQLSGGELQRVAIARALAFDAPFILADEPTGNLDSATSREVTDLLVERAAHQHGKGVIIATHDLAVAGRCDRRVVLDAPAVGAA